MASSGGASGAARKFRLLAARAKDPKTARAIERLMPGNSRGARDAAAKLLGAARGPEAFAALGLALREGVAGAAKALGASGHPGATGALRALLRKPSPLRVRHGARTSEGRYRCAYVRAFARAALARESEELTAALVRFWASSPYSAGRQQLGAVLQNADDRAVAVQVFRAGVAARSWDQARVVRACLRRAPREALRVLSGRGALGTRAGQRTAGALFAALRERPLAGLSAASPELLPVLLRGVAGVESRAAALKLLWGRREPEAIGALVRIFPRTEAGWERPRTALALATAGGPRATAVLARWLPGASFRPEFVPRFYKALRRLREPALAAALSLRRKKLSEGSSEAAAVASVLRAWGVKESTSEASSKARRRSRS